MDCYFYVDFCTHYICIDIFADFIRDDIEARLTLVDQGENVLVNISIVPIAVSIETCTITSVASNRIYHVPCTYCRMIAPGIIPVNLLWF